LGQGQALALAASTDATGQAGPGREAQKGTQMMQQPWNVSTGSHVSLEGVACSTHHRQGWTAIRMVARPSPGTIVSDRSSERPLEHRLQWPDGALQAAVALHQQLSIGDRDWHALKSQRSRRAAEQLAAALVQLLSGDQPAAPTSNGARNRALELIDHAQQWLRAEISDPGCPQHRR
jgi:hypothetical protein